MKNLKKIIVAVIFIAAFQACSSPKEKGPKNSQHDNKQTDSIQIRGTTNGNMSNTYPSN